jgi:hypothetical protein
MSVREIVGIAALIGGSLCGLLATLVSIEMVEQVNAKLPKENHFSSMGWYAPKTLRLFREYRRLFPSKNLHLKITSLAIIALVCLLCVAWAIGFF